MNFLDKNEVKGENSFSKNIKKEQTLVSDLAAKEEQLNKENSNTNNINNSQNLKQTTVDNSNNRNIKNNKNYGNSKFGQAQNYLDVGPFVPAGSNFE